MKQSVINVALKTLQKQDWESVFTTLHFRIGPMAILVLLHEAVPPTFYNKIAPMVVCLWLRNRMRTKTKICHV